MAQPEMAPPEMAQLVRWITEGTGYQEGDILQALLLGKVNA